MTSNSTRDFRAAIRCQPTQWLRNCLAAWRKDAPISLGSDTAGARLIAMVRAELQRRGRPAPFVDASCVTEYGLTQKLSSSVRVF